MRPFLPLLGLTVLTATLAAQSPIRVLTLDASRFGSCQGTSQQFSSSSFFQFAYLELTNPANFGPAGVVNRAVNYITPVPAITAADLANSDVVIVGQTADQASFSVQEISMLNSFLCKGGGVIMFGNWAAQALMPVTQGTLGSFGTAEVRINPGTPMSTGPFGTATTGAKLKGGWSGSYGSIGPTGIPCLSHGSNEALAASFQIGPGKLIVISDEELIASTIKIGCGGAGWDTETRRLWLNGFSWVVPQDGFAFTTNDVVFETFGQGCPGTGNIAPRVLWAGRPKDNGWLQVNVMNARPNTAGVYLSGIQRFTQGSCWLHVFPILFTIPVATDATGSSVLGSNLPVLGSLKGASLITQVALIDPNGTNGLSTSNGTEVRFR
ncbi:MAG: hypothetical protein H6832_04365 [Planctomycetes bacterium]|nr:hypothetical protein [Planctomycetota bacterium]MCB9890374.1 hypothetical protein [Planctomycetota bacterium]MCB9917616.1 hypothetical protein [Planctomycetota bacterium]